MSKALLFPAAIDRQTIDIDDLDPRPIPESPIGPINKDSNEVQFGCSQGDVCHVQFHTCLPFQQFIVSFNGSVLTREVSRRFGIIVKLGARLREAPQDIICSDRFPVLPLTLFHRLLLRKQDATEMSRVEKESSVPGKMAPVWQECVC